MARSNMQSRQSGSMVSFLVTAVIFVCLVVGGIYLLQKREGGNQQQSSKSVAVSNTPSATLSKSASPSSKAPASPSKFPAPTAAPTKPNPSQKSPTAPMPSTGPTDTVLEIIALSILTGTAVAYIQSHRARLALLQM